MWHPGTSLPTLDWPSGHSHLLDASGQRLARDDGRVRRWGLGYMAAQLSPHKITHHEPANPDPAGPPGRQRTTPLPCAGRSLSPGGRGPGPRGVRDRARGPRRSAAAQPEGMENGPAARRAGRRTGVHRLVPAPGTVLPALAWRHAGAGEGVSGAGAAPRLRLRVRGGQSPRQEGADRPLGEGRGHHGHAGDDLPAPLPGPQRQVAGTQHPRFRRLLSGE